MDGAVFSVTDPRVGSFGGRYFQTEIYNNGGGRSRVYDIQVLSVWAGVSNVIPKLSSTIADERISLSWSALANGFCLQASDTLQQNAWTNVTTITNTLNGTNTVIEDLAPSGRFYRMLKPAPEI